MGSMFKKILAATDGSDHAEKAVDSAIDLAAQHGARLTLLFVAPHRVVPLELRRMAEIEHIVEAGPHDAPRVADPAYPSAAIGSPELEETVVSSARIYHELGERLVGAAKQRAEERGITQVETLVEHGDPADQIIQAAEREGADLIVMGRRGLGDLKGLLLGSVTHKVCQLANCACLTLK
jgi:nucleotide-binding universal stress UspA family protein